MFCMIKVFEAICWVLGGSWMRLWLSLYLAGRLGLDIPWHVKDNSDETSEIWDWMRWDRAEIV